jgi:hypothetical protein
MTPYDDERYLQWVEEFRKLISEFLDTEGNTPESLTDEFENAKSEALQA